MRQGFDIGNLYPAAKSRWLKPSEVLSILINHDENLISPEPPNRPPGGSLFLFNRRVLRFFRKDGHVWRRKKDGRTIGEAHEQLKVENVPALSCYYAHGEENPCFQRRSYWMLDPAYEHIVLVHYRDVTEERYPGSSSSLSENVSLTSSQSSSPVNTQSQGAYDLSSDSPDYVGKATYETNFGCNINDLGTDDGSGNYVLSSQAQMNELLKNLERYLISDDDNDNQISDEQSVHPHQALDNMEYWINHGRGSHTQAIFGKTPCISERVEWEDNTATCMLPKASGDNLKQEAQILSSQCTVVKEVPAIWKELPVSTASTTTSGDNTFEISFKTNSTDDELAATDTEVYQNGIRLPSSEMRNMHFTSYGQPKNLNFQHIEYGGHDEGSETTKESYNYIESLTPAKIYQEPEETIFQYSGKGRYEGKSVVLSNETIEWKDDVQLPVENTSFHPIISPALFECSDYMVPPAEDSILTVAQKQLFSIREVSPEWAFSTENTKVIITGDFLCNYLEIDWKVMFGDVQVPAEIIQKGVIRCQAPAHAAGRVSLCLTSGNRESCSEVREFEYRANPETSGSERNVQNASASRNTEELKLLTKLTQTLLCEYAANLSQKEDGLPQNDFSGKLISTNDKWDQIIESLLHSNDDTSGVLNSLLQELLKDKLMQRLLTISKTGAMANCSLSRQEQSILHMISGLGFLWALNPILEAGVGVNFRDSKGWTALHWAARFGREEMVSALLTCGASAGAVTDPTVQDPVGKTPAAIAAANGYKGLAGYLSEVALKDHLSSLTLEESEISKGSAELEAERAVEGVSDGNIWVHAGATEDQISLEYSLKAVRRAAQAAARIQSAFRVHSFKKKQEKAAQARDEYHLTPQEILELSSASKVLHGHHDQNFFAAVLCIQKKYRGWRGRKNFLKLRQHVVRIQAHVRGHQARKKYKEFLWTVGVFEKAILRWRRRGTGLRGFSVDSEPIDEEDDEDILKVFRREKVNAALDSAVKRVLSMVKSPTARQQYRRMIESFWLAKAFRELGAGPSSDFDGDAFQLPPAGSQ